MDLIVFEDDATRQFGPLTTLRHVAELRCGRWSMLERCERLAVSVARLWGRGEVCDWAHNRLGRRVNERAEQPTRFLSGRVVWWDVPVPEGDVLGVIDDVVVFASLEDPSHLTPGDALAGRWPELPQIDVSDCGRLVSWPWELVLKNADQIAVDLDDLPASGFAEPGLHVTGSRLHVGEGTTFGPGVVLDTDPGPIWIGRDVTIKANAVIEGPAVIGDGCTIQHHAQIHEGVTLGPRCKIGGEVEASIVQGFSNKQHYGFLGHSYLGEWINLGAGCTTSDLKNTYGTVAVPLLADEPPVDSGSLFCGLTCGDYAKLGINTAVPTGACIGVGSNVMGSRVPKRVEAMQWVVDGQSQPFDRDKAVAIATRMMQRRDRSLGEAGERLLRGVGPM